MKAGKVGILVIMISLAGMLGIGWFMSMDVVMTEKTVYNELTDITPLFGSEQAPEFTDYTPSTNYTGYYTDDSIINGSKYFDGVDYGVSTRANVYRLDLAPESSSEVDDYDLSGVTPDSTKLIHYWAVNETVNNVFSVNVISMENLITGLNLTTYNRFTLANSSEVSDYTEAGSFIMFARASDLTGDNNFKNPELTGTLIVESWITMPADEAANPILAIDYDTRTNMVNAYYDVDMTEKAGLIAASDVYLLWGGSGTFSFGDEMDYTAYRFPGATYMDPTKGVELT